MEVFLWPYTLQSRYFCQELSTSPQLLCLLKGDGAVLVPLLLTKFLASQVLGDKWIKIVIYVNVIFSKRERYGPHAWSLNRSLKIKSTIATTCAFDRMGVFRVITPSIMLGLVCFKGSRRHCLDLFYYLGRFVQWKTFYLHNSAEITIYRVIDRRFRVFISGEYLRSSGNT